MDIVRAEQTFVQRMKSKNWTKQTIDNYACQVRIFLRDFQGRDRARNITATEIECYLNQKVKINSRKHSRCAIQAFYKLVIQQPMKLAHIPWPKKEKQLPIVLSQGEIQQMFSVCGNRKHKVILALLYSCGLRVSELINLKWEHIDRSRKIINIIQAKGKKDRQVMLPQQLIPLLESYWAQYKSKVYVLNGWNGQLQYSGRSVGQVVKQLAAKAGIQKRVWTHLMRHCTFTHMVESGTDINLIQRIAGHSSVKTTAIYTHISHNIISKVHSPIADIKI